MSLFPIPGPEKLRIAMEQNYYYYQNQEQAMQSPSRSNEDNKPNLGNDNTWPIPDASGQDMYAVSQPTVWPSQLAQGLTFGPLPTPAQSSFQLGNAGPTALGVHGSWPMNMDPTLAYSSYPEYTSPESGLPSYSMATSGTTVAPWETIQPTATSFTDLQYDSPCHSDYTTSSRHSLVDSSPYTRSDGCFPSNNSPYIKLEDAGESSRPRLHSLPGTTSSRQPPHSNPNDVYASPPLTANKQSEWLALDAQVKVDEEQDFKPVLLPQPSSPQPRRTRLRRTVSEDTSVSAAEQRGKRGYTTSDNSTCCCDQCGKLFQRSYNLKAHMDTHDPHRDQPHACQYPDCTRRFVRRTDLLRHEQSVHLKERKYRCPLCYGSFARKDTLRRHVDDGCPRRPEMRKRLE
ncbi:hypothetical protein DOTSEDRAFT_74144 [Dothistroma septosporum NZE10]|uniref:C2H2 type master regulator of conidiophore development brlA n=1 Tax=Dothistroma septosporum (strain NZE10 / CBS 128990) TaxID=675120 RepID=N1PEC6_DOTSN|nr:hypothetical protein DOTSEDRAFT_74144 [Dothistroma septosporum NZE10]